MRAQAFFTAASVDGVELAGRTAVVIDVIRATSTVITALAHGARAIYPTISTEEAIKLASSLGRDATLLCGERRGLKVEGFDLGNSPAEYDEETVSGKRLVMSTTNGTRAFMAANGAGRVLAGAFVNLGAVAAAVRDAEDVAVICAGKEDRFSLDDAVCAGLLLRAYVDGRREKVETNDAADAAVSLAGEHAADADFLRTTAAGAALVEIGLESDLSLCAARDRFDLVPEMDDRMIRLPSARSGEED